MVARSADLSGAVILLASFIIVRSWGPSVARHFVAGLELAAGKASAGQSPAQAAAALSHGISEIMIELAPLAVALMVVAFTVSALQVKLHFTPKAFKFKGERINPIKGMRKLFSPRSAVELVKSTLKLILVALVAYYSVKGGYVRLHGMTGAAPAELMAAFLSLVFSMCLKVGVVMLFLGVLDYGYQRYEFEKSIRMTRHEVKQEYKQAEGDPHLRAAIRQRMKEMARQRMIQQVSQATMVVTNPTTYAVALEYRRGMRAPRVVAKGMNFMAGRIKEEAKKHRVPIVEEPELARLLHRSVDVDQEIPPELYRAVAELLAYIMRIDSRMASRVA